MFHWELILHVLFEEITVILERRLRHSVLGRRSVLILANQRDSSFLSPARRLGLSDPFVRIITRLLTAPQPKIKLVLRCFKAAEALHKMAALTEKVLNNKAFHCIQTLLVFSVCHTAGCITASSTSRTVVVIKWGVQDGHRDRRYLCPPSPCSE